MLVHTQSGAAPARRASGNPAPGWRRRARSGRSGFWTCRRRYRRCRFLFRPRPSGWRVVAKRMRRRRDFSSDSTFISRSYAPRRSASSKTASLACPNSTIRGATGATSHISDTRGQAFDVDHRHAQQDGIRMPRRRQPLLEAGNALDIESRACGRGKPFPEHASIGGIGFDQQNADHRRAAIKMGHYQRALV